MYPRVPPGVACSPKREACSKSTILTAPSGVTRRFSDFRSRCATPCWWRATTASATRRPRSAASLVSIGLPRIRRSATCSPIETPSMSSTTSSSWSSASTRSKYPGHAGWAGYFDLVEAEDQLLLVVEDIDGVSIGEHVADL